MFVVILGKPVEVFVAFQVLDIGEINEEKMVNHLQWLLLSLNGLSC